MLIFFYPKFLSEIKVLFMNPDKLGLSLKLRPDMFQLSIIYIYSNLGTVILCPMTVAVFTPVVGSIIFLNGSL